MEKLLPSSGFLFSSPLSRRSSIAIAIHPKVLTIALNGIHKSHATKWRVENISLFLTGYRAILSWISNTVQWGDKSIRTRSVPQYQKYWTLRRWYEKYALPRRCSRIWRTDRVRILLSSHCKGPCRASIGKWDKASKGSRGLISRGDMYGSRQ